MRFDPKRALTTTETPEPFAALQVASLEPGDVLVFGVYEQECEERLCSDVISCLNVAGRALFPGRFAGVSPAWACHVAIFVGGSKIVHATGPDTTFLIEQEDAAKYFAENRRLCTVFRPRSGATAARAAELARNLASVEGPERNHNAVGLLAKAVLQAVFPGRSDGDLLEGIRRAEKENVSCLVTTRGLVTCSSLVSALVRVAAEDSQHSALVADIPSDLTPYELFVELLDHPAWECVAVARPWGLRETALPDPARARESLAVSRTQRNTLALAVCMVLALAFGLAFTLGLGRALHSLLLGPLGAGRTARSPSSQLSLV